MHTRSNNTGRGHPSVLAIGLIALLVFSVFGLTMMRPQNVLAENYNLTTDTPTLTATINGAIWERFTPSNSSGTGNFNTFLQVQKTGVERGYNTDAKAQFDEGSSPNFNRSFPLANVPFVQLTEGGTVYREFQLDINQVGSDPNWYLSLDQFQVWLTDNPKLTNYDETAKSFAAGATKVYELGDNTIKMDFRANDGSGKRDYRVLVPQSLFDGKAGQYVVLFVHHGEVWPANDGFEEWGCRIPEVGRLSITKALSIPNGVLLSGIDTSFIVHVTGPSGTFDHTFVVTDGVVQPPNPWTLINLAPGSYTITEDSYAPLWTTGIAPNPASVTVGGNTAVTVTNTYHPASLSVTKAVSIPEGVLLSAIDTTFDVHVTGPSGTFNHTFTVTDGVVVAPNPWTLTNLIPGSYAVTETDYTPLWTTGIVTSPAVLAAGDAGSVTVTNIFVPGSLDVTKSVVIPPEVVNASSITDSFTVKVTGPSYPAPTGTTQVFTYNGTAVSPTAWHLTNLIPGTYVVTESVQGVTYAWTVGISGSGAVTAGNTSTVTVTNTFVPGSLEITKIVNFNGVIGWAGISEDFTVKVTGPSYPAPDGTTHIFHLVNGVLQAPNPWVLDHLLPGDYTITEADAGTEWTETVPAAAVAVPAGGVGTANVTNDYNPAKIIVDKITKPAGDPQLFDFQPSWTESFQLADETTPFDSGWLIPGTYSVAEINIPAGWVLTGLSVNGTTLYTIDMNAMSASVTLAPGDVVTITFEDTAPMTTRTQGFWATHLELADAVWFGGTCGGHTFTGVIDQTIGTHLIDTDAKLMSAFWSNIAKTSTGAKRSALDQARMQLLQQLVAAILNNNAFGSSPTGPISIAQAKWDFQYGTLTQVKAAMSAMALFNEGGDSGVFTPGISANAKGAKAAAALAPTFWDNLP